MNFEVDKIKVGVKEFNFNKNFNIFNVEMKNEFTFNSFTSFDANMNKDAVDIEEGEGVGNCYSQYLAYYVYALILGAYINVKRLYKMGPI
jgi:hypothetical protein